MHTLLGFSAHIDRVLGVMARVGAWAGVVLILVTVWDVVTRYLGIPRGFGINATELQESEAWLHTFLFSTVIGYAYLRQSHVRIDLIRDRLKARTKYLIEITGCLVFLLPYCAIAGYYTYRFAHKAYTSGEISSSTVGLSNVWILKSFLLAMFVLLGLAGISQLIKAAAGFAGKLPPELVPLTVGGDLEIAGDGSEGEG